MCLIINDLEFCDRELAEDICGGTTVYTPYGAWSSSSSASYNANYSSGYSADSTGTISAYIAPGVSSSVAGAVASAVSDGGHYVSTYANAST